MALYKVVVPAGNYQKLNGVDTQIVQAASSAEAKALAAGFSGSDSHAAWTDATATDLSTTDLTGWVFRVQVSTATPVDVTVTGVAGNTLDDIGTALAAALLTAVGTAIAGTAHSAYNTSTNLLTVSSIADGIGDKNVTVTVTPPTGLFESSYSWAQADVIGTVTDLGIAGAVLTVQLSTTWIVPARCVQVKSVS